jgi:hypothetical protein
MTQPHNPKRPRYYTGVTLQPDVLTYVDALARQTDTNRSWIINAIVQQYAKLAQANAPMPLESKEAIIRL